MSLQSSLCAYIETKSAITNIIGTAPCKFLPQMAKGGVLPPLAIYSRSSVKRYPTSAGSKGLVTTVVRIASFGEDYDEATDLADQFRIVLDGKRGTVGDQYFDSCLLIDESDSLEPVQFAQNDAPHFVAQEYQIIHYESIPTL